VEKKEQFMAEGPAVPDAVLRGLKAIDAQADCLWIPGPSDRGLLYAIGVWHPPNRVRKRLARLILDREEGKPITRRNARAISWAKYVMRGFRPVFGIKGRLPDMRDVAEFRERDWRYRHQFDQELIERELEATGEKKQAEQDNQYRDHIHQFATEEFKAVCREQRHVPFSGYAERFGTRWRKANGRPDDKPRNPYSRLKQGEST
jgi:hypothetical protein